MKTLIIDDKTVRKLVSMREAIREVEKVFRYFGEGRVQMPAKVYIHLDRYNGDFRAMPVYIEPLKSVGIKWVNVHPDNRQKGLATVMAIIILNDLATGRALSIMDGTYVTNLRTGAAGGVAAKYLARKDSRKLALVGCGAQAETQFNALAELFNIKEVNVCGTRISEAEKFVKMFGKLKTLRMRAVETIKECVRDADIVVTTTPSRRPLVKLEWLKKGAHINAIGADAKGKQELDAAILKKGKVVVDAWEQASHSGEINVPFAKGQLSKKDVYANIGEIVSGRKKGRTNKNEITVFDSTGLAIQDLAIANFVYKKAKKKKLGNFLKMQY